MMHPMPTTTAPVARTASTTAPLLRLLGILGMVASPGLAVSFAVQGAGENYTPGGIGALFGLAFTVGWFANVLGLWHLRATGNHIAARIPLAISLVTVPLAGIFNIFEFVAPGSDSIFYTITDLSWPLSMTLMLITGIIVAFAGVLRGWTRFVPLLCGLWFPVGMLLKSLMDPAGATIASGIHSAVGWFLLGLVIFLAARVRAR